MDEGLRKADIGRLWHPTRNGALSLDALGRGSHRSVWWRCEQGHEWRSRVDAVSEGTGCPYCAGLKVLPGFNDLATTDPSLAAEWSARNTLRPEEVNRGSHKTALWNCPQGHDYAAPVYSRVRGSGCPYCTGRRVLPGFNDLATTHPRVARQWVRELNGGLRPDEVTKGSNRKIWWRCAEGHYWQATVYSRTRARASDCPVCAGTMRAGYPQLRPAAPRPAAVREPQHAPRPTP